MLNIKKQDIDIGQKFEVIKPLNCYKLIQGIYSHGEEVQICDIIVTTKTKIDSKSNLRFSDGINEFWCSWQKFKRSTLREI
jgi:hypothetical protein